MSINSQEGKLQTFYILALASKAAYYVRQVSHLFAENYSELGRKPFLSREIIP